MSTQDEAARWAEIIPLLREFQSHLSPSIPPLQIIPANNKSWSDERYREQEATGIFQRRGVYLIFDRNEKLQYVGVTTKHFCDRVWVHDKDIERQWTDVIPFEDAYYFLALGLEYFLIDRLKPPGNAMHVTKQDKVGA